MNCAANKGTVIGKVCVCDGHRGYFAFFCWKMARVASADGGAQVAFCLRRQRSESEARMLITTVRLSGCWGLEVLKSLAPARCCSLSMAAPVPCAIAPDGAGAMKGPGPPAAAADCMMAGSMCRVCCIAWERSARGSVRIDIAIPFACHTLDTLSTHSRHTLDTPTLDLSYTTS